MDRMSQRIQGNMHLVRIYRKSNCTRLYRWGLTSGEIDTHLYSALWQTLLYRDEHPKDDLGEYQRFWRFARSEFGKVWRELNHAKGLPGASLYQLHEEPDPTEPDDTGNPADLAECLESLESLTDRQQAILGALAGSGNRRSEAVAETLGEASGAAVLTQLSGIRETIKTGQPPNTQGIKQQVADYLGLPPCKATTIRCKNVLASARNKLDLSIPRGSRYTRHQCDQIMGWLKANARAQWFQANNPVSASTEPKPCAHIQPCAPALSVVAHESHQLTAIL